MGLDELLPWYGGPPFRKRRGGWGEGGGTSGTLSEPSGHPHSRCRTAVSRVYTRKINATAQAVRPLKSPTLVRPRIHGKLRPWSDASLWPLWWCGRWFLEPSPAKVDKLTINHLVTSWYARTKPFAVGIRSRSSRRRRRPNQKTVCR